VAAGTASEDETFFGVLLLGDVRNVYAETGNSAREFRRSGENTPA
jgi:hypothetical protein